MKIGISSTGKEITSMIDPRFGRCNYFVIYDTNDENVKFVENKGQASGGGAGIAAAQQIIDEQVGVVITGNLGPNAFDLIKKSDIKVYDCGNIKVEAAIELFKEGRLEELNAAGPSHSGSEMGNGNMLRGGR